MEELSLNTVPVGRTRPGFGPGGKKTSVGDYHDQFVSMILKAQVPPPETTVSSTTNKRETSIDTSTFTVCLRVRPLLGDELTARGESFNCVIPGSVKVDTRSGERTEEAIVLLPASQVLQIQYSRLITSLVPIAMAMMFTTSLVKISSKGHSQDRLALSLPSGRRGVVRLTR